MKICQLTSVHHPFDTRIFHRICRSLIEAGHEVVLVAPHDRAEVVDGIRIVPVPRYAGRGRRALTAPWTVFRLAKAERADIYHFHDPELLPVGLALKLVTRARVVYDVHETYPEYIRAKEWLPRPIRVPAAEVVRLLEHTAGRLLDAVVVAGEDLVANFPRARKVVVLRNFPVREIADRMASAQREEHFAPVVIYTGLLSRDRGIAELVSAVRMVTMPVRLVLVGWFDDAVFEREVRALADERVVFAEKVAYEEVFQRLREADIAALLFLPVANNIPAIHGRNNKVFEYMAVGLPILASDLPGWRGVIEDQGVGITVNPLDPVAIARGIERLLEDPGMRARMGARGRELFLTTYNWNVERERLLSLYRDWDMEPEGTT